MAEARDWLPQDCLTRETSETGLFSRLMTGVPFALIPVGEAAARNRSISGCCPAIAAGDRIEGEAAAFKRSESTLEEVEGAAARRRSSASLLAKRGLPASMSPPPPPPWDEAAFIKACRSAAEEGLAAERKDLIAALA